MSYNSENGITQKKSKISKETLLQYVINEGIIDVTYVQEQIEMKKRDEMQRCVFDSCGVDIRTHERGKRTVLYF